MRLTKLLLIPFLLVNIINASYVDTGHAKVSIVKQNAFFDENNERVLACFFTKMYDESKTIKSERKKLYDDLQGKYGSKIQF